MVMLVVHAGGLERRLSPCISSPHLRYLLRSRPLSANGLISQHQHGFLAKHSTCTQLLETVNDWSIASLNRHVVDVVYFDFAKAFDSVSHTTNLCVSFKPMVLMVHYSHFFMNLLLAALRKLSYPWPFLSYACYKWSTTGERAGPIVVSSICK